MSCLKFEWDDAKAALNKRKHHVSFKEAQTIWLDPNRVDAPDEKHSEMEPRRITIGLSSRLRLLTVAYTERDEETTIRFISARRATATETRRYTDEA